MTANDPAAIQRVHRALFPTHGPTRLHPLPELAAQLGCAAVYVKDESVRFGLPAFKILGASWAIAATLGERWGVQPWDVEGLRAGAKQEPVTIYTATDGNHGRAVAHTAALLGLTSRVWVPHTVEPWSIAAIASEGATVTKSEGDYDAAVEDAKAAADADANGLLIQDMAWEGYDEMPARITAGYMTISAETTSQLPTPATAVITPVGVGSLAHSVVQWFHGGSFPPLSGGDPVRVLTAEPDVAACLHASLAAGEMTSVATGRTDMAGLNCGTVSTQAWPDLLAGVKAEDAIVVTDAEDAEAMKDLMAWGVKSGPCGAAALAAARKVKWVEGDVVVLICTEGPAQK